MAADRRALNSLALMATVHCLTGCAIGEVAGMAIGTAIGLSNLSTVLLAIVLAFFFGYSLTSLPLLRSGMALGAVVPIAFASDTLSIATMEAVDTLVVLTIPPSSIRPAPTAEPAKPQTKPIVGLYCGFASRPAITVSVAPPIQIASSS
jgi:hypothetical protein